jgi:PAS domain S-box-containing protein
LTAIPLENWGMLSELVAKSDELLKTAIEAIDRGEGDLQGALEALPAPIYVTDADGVITFYNKACIGFAGRRPSVGKDRWCVSWKLFTEDGEFVPHDQCPMAQAIKTAKPVRGAVAVAKRPDGTRVVFTPLPTPLFEPNGELKGAVNLLIDVTEARQIAELRAQSERCRRLAAAIHDMPTIDTLNDMADDCEAKAAQLECHLREAQATN